MNIFRREVVNMSDYSNAARIFNFMQVQKTTAAAIAGIFYLL
jgi:hypothetical protein